MRHLDIQTEDFKETRWFVQRVATCVNALSLTMRFWVRIPSTVIFPGLAALVKNHGLWLLFTPISALPSTSYSSIHYMTHSYILRDILDNIPRWHEKVPKFCHLGAYPPPLLD